MCVVGEEGDEGGGSVVVHRRLRDGCCTVLYYYMWDRLLRMTKTPKLIMLLVG